MKRLGWLLLLFVGLCVTSPGQAAELKTLQGQTVSGDLVSISDKEIVLAAGGKMVTTALANVLTLDLTPAAKLAADRPASQIELVDGTTILAKSWAIKKGDFTYVPLVGGKETALPIAAISSVVNNAQDEKMRKLWAEILGAKRDRDIIAVYRDPNLNPLKGTIGEGSADGTTIEFTLASGGAKRDFPIANAAGLVFFRNLNPLAPPVTLRLSDKDGNLYMVTSFTTAGNTLVAKTSSGVEFTLPFGQLAKLDYSRGKQTYLSDLQPSLKKLEAAAGERFGHLMLDKNLNGTGPMRLKGESFSRGLAMFTYTELEYGLKGDFAEFRAVAGIDDEVNGADGSVHLLIEGDGKELLSLTFSRQDKVRAQPIALNIKDINTLRIVVSDPDGKDIGKHLSIGNAQVTK